MSNDRWLYKIQFEIDAAQPFRILCKPRQITIKSNFLFLIPSFYSLAYIQHLFSNCKNLFIRSYSSRDYIFLYSIWMKILYVESSLQQGFTNPNIYLSIHQELRHNDCSGVVAGICGTPFITVCLLRPPATLSTLEPSLWPHWEYRINLSIYLLSWPRCKGKYS